MFCTRCPHIREICRNRTAHPRMDVLYLTNAEGVLLPGPPRRASFTSPPYQSSPSTVAASARYSHAHTLSDPSLILPPVGRLESSRTLGRVQEPWVARMLSRPISDRGLQDPGSRLARRQPYLQGSHTARVRGHPQRTSIALQAKRCPIPYQSYHPIQAIHTGSEK